MNSQIDCQYLYIKLALPHRQILAQSQNNWKQLRYLKHFFKYSFYKIRLFRFNRLVQFLLDIVKLDLFSG